MDKETAKRLFGSDDEDDDDDNAPQQQLQSSSAPPPTSGGDALKAAFGSDLESLDSAPEEDAQTRITRKPVAVPSTRSPPPTSYNRDRGHDDDGDDNDEGEGGRNRRSQVDLEMVPGGGVREVAATPFSSFHSNSNISMVYFPPEISIERTPWDPEEAVSMDLKTALSKQYAIRNRIVVDDTGEEVIQTNAALIEYEDGTIGFVVGKQRFECRESKYQSQTLAGEIFAEIHGANSNERVLQKVGIVNSKLQVRPQNLSRAINMKKTEKRKIERTVFTIDELDEKKAFADYRAMQQEERKKAKQMSEKFPTRTFANFLENSDEDDFDSRRAVSRFDDYDDDEMAERLESAKKAPRAGRAMPKQKGNAGSKRRAEESDHEDEEEEEDEDLDGFIVNDEDEDEEDGGGFAGGSRGKRRRVLDDDEDE
eukprot:TRINITY_DN77773_c0_g1_i1.p1 TRINITY_DN77773_c0_g1~~TRINITY_DN77773_c0_g1_i1.p1  ORF type:complete len:456 (-),score=147.98 TRINITY_DN77773_c0_g1_i1:34-1305(-)